MFPDRASPSDTSVVCTLESEPPAPGLQVHSGGVFTALVPPPAAFTRRSVALWAAIYNSAMNDHPFHLSC